MSAQSGDVTNSYKIAKDLGYGYMTVEEIDFLKHLVSKELPFVDVKCVNIGAGAGTSALAMLEARDDIHVTTVDIHKGGPLGSLKGEKNALQAAKFMHWSRYHQILGDSKEVGKGWSVKAHFVFIDGDHSYDGVLGDLQAWSAHVVPDGIIAFHDYLLGDCKWPDVVKVVDAYMKGVYEELGHIGRVIAFRM